MASAYPILSSENEGVNANKTSVIDKMHKKSIVRILLLVFVFCAAMPVVLRAQHFSVRPFIDICKGETVDLMDYIYDINPAASGIPFYFYENSMSNPPLTSSVVSPSATTTYYVVLPYPIDEQQTIKISVYEMPKVTAMPDTTVCLGSSLQLKIVSESNTTSTYWALVEDNWEDRVNKEPIVPIQPPSTIPNPNRDFQLHYILYGINDKCYKEYAKDEVIVTVRYPRKVFIEDVSVPRGVSCLGDSLDLNKYLIYSVNEDGSNMINSIDNPDAFNINVTANWSPPAPSDGKIIVQPGSTIYEVQINGNVTYNDLCSSDTLFVNKSIKVRVVGDYPIPVFFSHGAIDNPPLQPDNMSYSRIVCVGDSVSDFSVMAGSCKTIIDVKPLPPTPADFTFDRVTANGSWSYHFFATEGPMNFKAMVYYEVGNGGTIDSVEITATLNTYTKPYLARINDTTVCKANNNIIDLNDMADPSYVQGGITWLNGPNVISGGILYNPQETSDYTVFGKALYRCRSMGTGWEIRSTIRVTVDSIPWLVMGAPPAEVCEGDTIQLTANSNAQIIWQTDKNDPNTAFNPRIAAPGVSTMYYALATNNCGTKVDSVFLNVKPIAPLAITPASPIVACQGVPLTLTAGSPLADSIVWKQGEKGNSVTIYPAAQAEQYWATSYRGGCTYTDTVSIFPQASPRLEVSADQSICSGQAVTVWARTTTGETVVWDPGQPSTPFYPAKDTTFFVSATGINGCISRDTIHVYVSDSPIVVAMNDTTVCKGTIISLQVHQFSPGAQLSWNVSPTTFPVNETKDYIVTARSPHCPNSDGYDTVRVTMVDYPVLVAMKDTAICQDTQIELKANVTPAGLPLVWDSPGGATNVTPGIGYHTYHVSAINQGLCASKDSVNIAVIQRPEVVAMDDVYICYKDTVRLTIKNSFGNIVWSTPSLEFVAEDTEMYIVTASNAPCPSVSDTVLVDVSELREIEPDVLPPYQRDYFYSQQISANNLSNLVFDFVGSLPEGFTLDSYGLLSGTNTTGKPSVAKFTVRATDSRGCQVTHTYSLREGKPDIEIPDLFTPNGDGYNDYFMEGFKVEIYDRAGLSIFKGNDGWDGTHKGRPAPSDTYFYIVYDGGYKWIGYVTLIRDRFK